MVCGCPCCSPWAGGSAARFSWVAVHGLGGVCQWAEKTCLPAVQRLPQHCGTAAGKLRPCAARGASFWPAGPLHLLPLLLPRPYCCPTCILSPAQPDGKCKGECTASGTQLRRVLGGKGASLAVGGAGRANFTSLQSEGSLSASARSSCLLVCCTEPDRLWLQTDPAQRLACLGASNRLQ